VLIGLGGSLPRNGCSRLSPISAHWPAVRVVVSLEIACGGLRLLRGRRSLRGRQPLERFLQWIISGSERSSLWIDAICAKETEKLWTTFFFIVMWLLLCGIMSFLGLVCLGLCLGELSICLHVGGRRVSQGALQFGRWCLFAFFGVFGRREILGVLKTWRIPWRISLPRFFICCIFGRRPFCLPRLLAFLIFLFVFHCLLRRFLVYTSNVFRGAPYAFYKISFTYKKKKKEC
jgi:hypothetical protein